MYHEMKEPLIDRSKEPGHTDHHDEEELHEDEEYIDGHEHLPEESGLRLKGDKVHDLKDKVVVVALHGSRHSMERQLDKIREWVMKRAK